MPQYEFKCEKCGEIYIKIVKMCQEYDRCDCCSGVTKRTHTDIPSPAQIEEGVGGVYHPKMKQQVE